MNGKRLLAAVVAVFIGIWITDFLIHAVWLAGTYRETASLWRTEAEMQTYFPILLLGQFVTALTFVGLWAKGFAAMRCWGAACLYGFLMGLFREGTTLIMYAVQPLPPKIAMGWFASGVIQGILMGLLVCLVYKPRPDPDPAAAAAEDRPARRAA